MEWIILVAGIIFFILFSICMMDIRFDKDVAGNKFIWFTLPNGNRNYIRF